MADALRIAIVGCGTIAPTHADAIIADAGERVRLVACSDIDPAPADAFRRRYNIPALSWPNLLDAPDIDAVSICTPTGTHAELGVQALNAGKHVIIEKPLDVTPEACDRLIDAQRATGKTLACICQHRFDASTIFVHDAVTRGDLGPIALVEARVTWHRTQQYYDSAHWRGTWALDGGGCLMNQGVHTVDLMLWLCGPVESVYAQTRTAAHERIEVEDCVAATVTFANGAIGSIIASTAAYPGFPVRLAIHGAQGSAVLEGDALETFSIIGEKAIHGNRAAAHAVSIATGGTREAVANTTADSAVDEPASPTTPAKWGDSHRAQILDFARCCRIGQRPLVGGVEGRAAVEVIRAVYQSAKSGKEIYL